MPEFDRTWTDFGKLLAALLWRASSFACGTSARPEGARDKVCIALVCITPRSAVEDLARAPPDNPETEAERWRTPLVVEDLAGSERPHRVETSQEQLAHRSRGRFDGDQRSAAPVRKRAHRLGCVPKAAARDPASSSAPTSSSPPICARRQLRCPSRVLYSVGSAPRPRRSRPDSDRPRHTGVNTRESVFRHALRDNSRNDRSMVARIGPHPVQLAQIWPNPCRIWPSSSGKQSKSG